MGFIWVEEKEDDEKFTKHMSDNTKALEATIEGLKSDITKKKKALKELEGVTVEDYNNLKTENAKLKKDQQDGETDTAKQLRIMQEQIDADRKKREKLEVELEESKKKESVDKPVLKSLVAIGVKKELLDAAILLTKSKVTKDEDGKYVIGGKTIAEAVKDWSATEEGKNFVLANRNHGGDSRGGDSTNQEGSYEKYFDKKAGTVNYTKQAELRKKDPKLHAELTKKFK